MSKLKYFPFGEKFDLRMGTAVFSEKDQLIEIDDEHYIHEVQAKRKLLESDHQYYYRSNPDTLLAQWDVVDKVLSDLAFFHSTKFQLIKTNNNWHWINKILNEETSFVFGDANSLPLEPLDWVGRQVQEDLVILSNDNSATLVAGQLCFANGWAINDKFGQSFLSIHAPAPKMIEPTMQSAQKLMEKILEKKPVWRSSWNFKLWNALDQSSKHNAWYKEHVHELSSQLTINELGNELFIRIERQTLTRLPRSQHILFGIHFYQTNLNNGKMHKQQAQNMLGVLQTTPQEMLDYKMISPFKETLTSYLENIINSFEA